MKKLLLLILPLVFFGCSGDKLPAAGKEEASSQTMPTIMIFPSDALMLRMGFLKEVPNQGTMSYQRDYQEAFIRNPEIKFAISSLQEEFSKNGFKLEDMEQQLKQITNNNAMDDANGLAKDIKSELLNTVRPDYIIEVDYENKINEMSRNGDGAMTFTIKCLDVYTNKAVASCTEANVKMEANSSNMAAAIKSVIGKSMGDFKTQIGNHFTDLKKNGVEITLRVATKNDSGISLDDDCGDEEIGEKIIAWLKQNTKNQAFKMVKNTKTEMYFTNIRIKSHTDEGAKYTAYDFAKDLKKGLKKGCSLEVENSTQSIGDAMVIIEKAK
jgi:hypothetical protein